MLNPMLILLLIISLLAGGCATIKNYPDRTVNLPEDVKALNDKFSLEEYLKLTDKAGKKSYRNDFINAKILAIDQSFETFQEDLVRESGLKDLGADWANLALTGAAAVVPLAQTKTVLTAIATGITGAKGSVDTNLFFKKTVVALITQMKADRETKRTDILKKMDLDTDKYPLTLALTDLEEYYKAGTLPQALISISATAGAKISAEKGNQKDLLTGKYVKDPAGELLQKFWMPDGVNVNKINEAKLLEWMGNNGIVKDVMYIPPLIMYAEYSTKRAKAVKDLGLQ